MCIKDKLAGGYDASARLFTKRRSEHRGLTEDGKLLLKWRNQESLSWMDIAEALARTGLTANAFRYRCRCAKDKVAGGHDAGALVSKRSTNSTYGEAMEKPPKMVKWF